jgi:predicted nucleic acid-binding protein
LNGLEAHHSDRILPITTAIADRWGRLSLKQPLPVTDGLITATALEHKLTVVTRNTDAFLRSGVNILDPFAA